MKTMTSLLYTTAVSWLILCIRSVSAQSPIFMMVNAGSSVVLPCDWTAVSSTPSSNQSLYIEWRTLSETVFERLGEEHYEGEGYKGRVDVPEDKLKKGNCSLVLKEVKAEDAGVYQSYLLEKQQKRSLQSKRVFIQSVELSVHKTAEEHVEERNAVSDGAGLNCAHLLISASCLFIYYLFLPLL
ncbi:hypothetical protein AMEX_G4286 [Astyanax mexicanus]|uniref:Immunoglobulin V-set domain-containing protein n=1 Tax=Astyanax mexicanus TaxID=7994 RepID=A0A8T2MAL2_ASTMX|nr:hypothetical protein AMEX_G4286 [Astyanax mexicanus]